MKKDRTAQVVTAAVIALVAAVVVIRQTGWSPPPVTETRKEPTPQDAIYSMLDAAREGDVDTYLEFYTGQMRATLEQAISEKGESSFADYLRDSNKPIKGIAITEPETLAPNSVRARVEYVFADRNEVQIIFLEKLDGNWRITRMDSTRRVETLVPYGTPVQ